MYTGQHSNSNRQYVCMHNVYTSKYVAPRPPIEGVFAEVTCGNNAFVFWVTESTCASMMHGRCCAGSEGWLRIASMRTWLSFFIPSLCLSTLSFRSQWLTRVSGWIVVRALEGAPDLGPSQQGNPSPSMLSASVWGSLPRFLIRSTLPRACDRVNLSPPPPPGQACAGEVASSAVFEAALQAIQRTKRLLVHAS